MSIISKSIQYSEFGVPADVLTIVEEELPAPKGNQVLVKILVAPINPADLLIIQGTYPVKPKLPTVPGNEFVAEILSVGDNVKDLQEGQRVVPYESGLGTWRTHAIYTEDQLLPISNKIGIVEAATLTVNPCTAYRMLKDFVNLQPGDVVIQNGANSAVGQAVHQLCKAWNVESVGIIRNRPDIDALKSYLKNMGASEVLTEEELLTTTIFGDKLKKPKLALNCVGGKSASEITRQLDNKGVMVTYGGISRDPVTVLTGDLVYKDITFRGFWRTRWTKENASTDERKNMLNELCTLMEDGKIKGPVHELVPLVKVNEAAAVKSFADKKYIIDLQSK